MTPKESTTFRKEIPVAMGGTFGLLTGSSREPNIIMIDGKSIIALYISCR
jgi:hypothetical protein